MSGSRNDQQIFPSTHTDDEFRISPQRREIEGPTMRTTPGTATLLSLAALVLLSGSPGDGRAQGNVTYAPSFCSTDAQGMVWVRLYPTGEGFKFPYTALNRIDGRPVEDRGPIPLPDDPEGCPGNPIVARNFSFDFAYQSVIVDRNPQGWEAWQPTSMTVHGYEIEENDWMRDRFVNKCKDWTDKSVTRVKTPFRDAKTTGCTLEKLPGYAEHSEAGGYEVTHEGDLKSYVLCRSFPYGKHCDGFTAVTASSSVAWRLIATERRPLPEAQISTFTENLRQRVLAARAPEIDAGRLKGTYFNRKE
ncbi:hypothetical protein KHP62_01080 [Rhodobacteraceae bacterium NNCM2]|nr:hypothetical protein [Coraliihabitans acroporae]